MLSTYLIALGGGALIGLAATALWLGLGRVAGISSIWGELLVGDAAGRTWRLAFVAGMLVAGVAAARIAPTAITASPPPLAGVAVAGLLVGFGTRLGSGCTSGHGVCGLSRGSPRSLAAVMTFMATGAATAFVAGVVS